VLNHTNLGRYFQDNFVMVQHGYHVAELEEMLPFERQIYLDLLDEYLSQLKENLDKK
jgi:hypothetical protein